MSDPNDDHIAESSVEEDGPLDKKEAAGHAPLIQISHPNVPQGAGDGIDNPVFDLIDEQEPIGRSSPDASVKLRRRSRQSSVTIKELSPPDTEPTSEDVSETEKSMRGSTLNVPIGIRHRKPSIDTIGSASDLEGTSEEEGGGRSALGVPDTRDHLSLPTSTSRWGSSPSSPGGRSLLSTSECSEIIRLDRLSRKDSIGSYHSEEETPSPTISSVMSGRLKELVRRFSTRTEYFKEKTIQPPTPSTDGLDAKSATSAASAANLEPPGRQHRLDSFVPMSSRASGVSGMDQDGRYIGFGKCKIKVPKMLKLPSFSGTLDATNRFYILWLAIVTIAYMYNATSCTLRACFSQAQFAFPMYADYVPKNTTQEICDSLQNISTSVYDFVSTAVYENVTNAVLNTVNNSGGGLSPSTVSPAVTGENCRNVTVTEMVAVPVYLPGYETDENRIYWFICDYTADFLYLMDILLVKNRVRFVNNGLLEKDRKECAKHYFSQRAFKMDVLSLIPLELFYLIPAVNFNSLLRLPRLLKLQVMWEFFDKLDHMVKSSHFVRVARTLTYMLFLIHLEACGYYSMSAYEGLGLNEWVYNGEGNAYIRCVYLATKTATSIGNNPKPENQDEYMFMIVYWLSGVFVFAMLIGQIRDIFEMAAAAKDQYRKTMDNTIYYMKSLNIPKELQDRVKTWFNYNWEHSKTLNENSLLEALPKKMKADLAIHVHYSTLSKVQLFQDCDKNLLFDLVLKLKPVLYLPKDYICRKGEVGTEMYIVMQGQVEVVGGENNSIVFATLHTGSVFGEISLLALAGGNRRTADVRSKGFSQLFILSKFDFEEAMSDYPEAQKILRKKAKKLLQQNAKKTEESKKMESEEIIKSRAGTPKLLRTVVQVVQPGSKMHDLLGTKRSASRGSNIRPDSRVSRHSSQNNASKQSPPEQTNTEDEYQLDDDFEDEILVVEQTELPIEHPIEMNSDIDGDIDKGILKMANEEALKGTLGVTDDNNSISQVSINSGINSIMSTPTKSAPGRGGGVAVGGITAGEGVGVSGGDVKQGLTVLMDQATESTEDPTSAPAAVTYENECEAKEKEPSGETESPKNNSKIKSSKSMPIMSNKISPLTDRQVSGSSISSLLSFKSNKVVPAIGQSCSTEMSTLGNVPPENMISVSVEVHREISRTPSLVTQPEGEAGASKPAEPNRKQSKE